MTAIINGPYAGRPGAFWLNRFLKLFPVYYVVAVATLMAILVAPIHAVTFTEAWRLSWSWPTIVAELTVVPLAFDEFDWRLISPVWSVAVELVNYAIIFAITARGWKWMATVLLIAFAYQLGCVVEYGFDVHPRYTTWYAGVAPFSIGAATYYIATRVRVPAWLGAAAFVAWCANLAIADEAGNRYLFGVVLWYDNIVLSAAIVMAMAPLRSGEAAMRLDRFVGDLAYPIFLVHLLIAFVVTQLFPDVRGQSQPLFALLCAPLVLVISVALAQVARLMLEPARDRVRKGDRAAELELATI